MFEYTADEEKPSYALCQIIVDNKNNAHDKPLSISQKRKGKEIDHTDSNNGDKGETSLSHESMQQGGNFENARQYGNPSNLEMFFALVIQGGELSEFLKHFSKEYIVQVFSREMDEIEIPDASPKEHSTEAAVRNPRKRGRFTCTNTMEEGTFAQGQEQVKVEMSASNSYAKKPTSLRRDTNRNCSEFGKQSSHHGNCNEKNAEQGTNTINMATIPETWPLGNSYGHEMVEPNQLSPNFIANSTEPSTSFIATTEGWLGHQMFDPNANVQHPDNLFVNFNANSTEGMENSKQLPSYSTIAPGPSTSNHATSVSEIPDWLTIANEWLDLDDLS